MITESVSLNENSGYVIAHQTNALKLTMCSSRMIGELLCQLVGIQYAYKQDILSVHLPNSLNASFSFPLFILITMLLYIPLFPPMYMHMFSQRKKVLGTKKED